MPFRVRIDPAALQQIEQLATWLRNYSEDFATEQIERLDRILRLNLGEAPLTWSYFPLTGAPYRAYLFRVCRQTQYWIIYTVDEEAHTVNVLSSSNADAPRTNGDWPSTDVPLPASAKLLPK